MHFGKVFAFLTLMSTGAFAHENGGLPTIINNDNDSLDTAKVAHHDSTKAIIELEKMNVFGQHYQIRWGPRTPPAAGLIPANSLKIVRSSVPARWKNSFRDLS